MLCLTGCFKQSSEAQHKTVRHVSTHASTRQLKQELFQSNTKNFSDQNPVSAAIKTVSRAPSIPEQIRELEARVTDVTIPVVAKANKVSKDDRGNIVLTYLIPMLKDELVEFYVQEMERYGWHQEQHIDGHEVLLQFKKPSTVCTISLRPTRKSWQGNKKCTAVISYSAR